MLKLNMNKLYLQKQTLWYDFFFLTYASLNQFQNKGYIIIFIVVNVDSLFFFSFVKLIWLCVVICDLVQRLKTVNALA